MRGCDSNDEPRRCVGLGLQLSCASVATGTVCERGPSSVTSEADCAAVARLQAAPQVSQAQSPNSTHIRISWELSHVDGVIVQTKIFLYNKDLVIQKVCRLAHFTLRFFFLRRLPEGLPEA